jgi:hypothetical protein
MLVKVGDWGSVECSLQACLDCVKTVAPVRTVILDIPRIRSSAAPLSEYNNNGKGSGSLVRAPLFAFIV